jgi:hypothetical protein
MESDPMPLSRMALLPLLLWAVPALGQQALKADDPPKPPEPTALDVSPAAEPVPALKYRLFPVSSDLNPGDAAPVYLRIRHETLTEAVEQLDANCEKWLEMPLDEFPTAEARKFVNQWGSKLRQIDFGAHRQTCDWNYTLPEQRLEAITILLPDAQEMRRWGRLLALKVRVEVAERNYDEAVRTLETGLAFGRHVGDGPFLINNLVGLAIEGVLLDRVEELIRQPGAPNLYWALTALPRPLVPIRRGLEVEQRMAEFMVPELTRLDDPREPEEWGPFLDRLQGRISNLIRLLSEATPDDTRLKALAGTDPARYKREVLPEARKAVKARRNLSDDQLAAMSDDQVVATHIVDQFRELRDEAFAGSYLPAAEAIRLAAATSRKLEALKAGPAAWYGSLVPAIQAGIGAELRADRRVAALRVVEALRLFAAAHDGKLPDRLDEITEVPVPADPATGRPFEYRREGEAAQLSGETADLPLPRIAYRITVKE